MKGTDPISPSLAGRDLAGVLGVVLVWGLGFTLTKPAVEHFPPFFLMTVCFALTAAVLAVAERRATQTGHWNCALIAAFAIALQSMLIFKGLQGLDASTAVLLAQTQVPMAAVAAWLIMGERPDLARIAGLAAAFAGVAFIAGRPGARPDMVALATLLCGGAAWAVGQSLIARFGQDADGAVLLKRVALHGAAQLAVATAILETGQAQAVATATPGDWAGFAFIAAFAFAWAYVIWFRLLARYPVTAVTPFVMLMPVISVVFSAIMLGDRPSAVTLGGGVLIVAGVALASGVLRLRRGGAA